jgi:diguanylate cyclase (GGDEF)-like protein
MLQGLDLRTIVVAVGFVTVGCALIQFSIRMLLGKSARGLGVFAIGHLIDAAGAFALAAAPHAWQPLALLLLGPWFMLRGGLAFRPGRTLPQWLQVGVPLLLVGTAFLLGPWVSDNHRLYASSIAWAICAIVAERSLRRSDPDAPTPSRVFLAILRAVTVVALARLVLAAFGFGYPPEGLNARGGVQAVFLIAYALLPLAVTVAVTQWVQQRLQSELLRLAHQDGLTGLLNRRRFFEVAEKLWRSAPADDGYALFLIDVDRFKGINDNFGHPVGDDVLRRVSLSLTGALNGRGILGRYGGDEFCAVVVGVDARAAAEIAQELRVAVRSQPYTGGIERAVALSASLGFALRRPHETLEQLLHRADTATYTAKRRGRDQVAEG